MRPIFPLLALLLLLPLTPGDGFGQGSDAFRAGIAQFDITGDEEVAALDLTWETTRRAPWRTVYQLGAMVNLDGAAYGHVGVGLPLPLPGEIVATPSFSLGGYSRGRGLDLGSVLEFRSGVRVDRMITDDAGISLFFYHLSNASLGDRNPGAEVLGLGYLVRW